MERKTITISTRGCKRVFLAFCAAVLAVSAFFVIAVLLDFSVMDGFFDYKSILGPIAKILIALLAVASSAWLFLPLPPLKAATDRNLAVRFCSVGIATIGAILLVYRIVQSPGGSLEQISLLFLFLTVLYFALLASARCKRALPLLAFSPIGFASTHLLSIYFDMSQPINGELRILAEMALLAILFFMLSDIRLHLDLCSMKLRFTTACLGLALAVPYGVAELVLFFSNQGISYTNVLVAAFALLYAVYGGLLAWDVTLQNNVDSAAETERADV